MTDRRRGYHIMTWGCQMNEEDSEQMALYLEKQGYAPVGDPAEADVILLNTCSVRQKPEEKVYSKLGELRELKQQNPDLIIGVCGCMAQVESVQIKRRAPFVDMVIGTGNIAAIPHLLQRVQESRVESRESKVESEGAIQRVGEGARGRGSDSELGTRYSALSHDSRLTTHASQLASLRPAPVMALDLPPRRGAVVTDVPLRSVLRKPKLKAHVPIMYGCDKFCTFCIVPLTRGRERSRPTAEILAEIEGLARGGTREVTLLGQTVNSYGKNLAEGRVPFAHLLEQINAIRGIRRIRFTSPYPRDFTDELIEAIARLPAVCEHVHLPLQVADEELLRRMHRGYTVERYRDIVQKLRAAVPGIAITTDLMLGFPGETEAQFENTLRFVEDNRFDAAFMFAYSIRPGTKAADMPDQVPQEVKVARLNRLIALQNGITLEKNRALVGQKFEVLVEGRSPKDPTRMTGLTRTFKTVHFPGDARLIGKLVTIRAVEGHLTGLTGELAE